MSIIVENGEMVEKLNALRGQEQTDAPAMGGMTMK